MRSTRSERSLSIATVAMTPDSDPVASRERIAQLVQRIVTEHPDVRLILFGETILGWFYRGDETAAYHERIAEAIPGPSTELISRLATKHNVYLSFGLSEARDGKLFNTQVLVDPTGEIVAVHRKFWIRNPVFTAAERTLTTATVDGATVAILICADGRSLWLHRAIRRARADVVLASLADYATDLRLNEMMGTLADAWTVVANRYGEEPPRTWHGLITITDPFGRIRVHGMGKEQYLVCKLRLTRPGSIRRFCRRTATAGRLLVLTATFLVGWIGGKLLRRGGSQDTCRWRELRSALGCAQHRG